MSIRIGFPLCLTYLILVVVSWDPEIFHHLPASALWGRARALSSEGRQIIKVARAQIPSHVRGRNPERGPGKRPV